MTVNEACQLWRVLTNVYSLFSALGSPRLGVVEVYFLSLTDWVDLCAFSVRLNTCIRYVAKQKTGKNIHLWFAASCQHEKNKHCET